MSAARAKVCERCGTDFVCDVDGDCWCKKIPPVPSVPDAFGDCLCSRCLSQYAKAKGPQTPVEGEDYYWEGPNMVFTSAFHLKRGYCCRSSETGCRHCPYR